MNDFPEHRQKDARNAPVAVISQDRQTLQAARRRLGESGFRVQIFQPHLNLTDSLRDAGIRVAILDVQKPGPLVERVIQGFSANPALAAIPLLVFDPEGELDFHPVPFETIRNFETLDLSILLQKALAANVNFEKGGAPALADLRLSPAASQRFFEFIQRNTGILLEKGVAQGAEEIIRKRMFARKCLSTWEYLNFIQFKDQGNREFQRLIPTLTVGETSFFRTASHFAALKHIVIPDLLFQKRRGSSRLRLWSAGCATGEEVYSLAMTLHQEIADLKEWSPSVLGTDINQQAIQKAREGVYTAKEVRRIPEPLKERYFARMGSNFIVDPRIRKFVDFRAHNLNAWAAAAGFEGIEPGLDVVFCENVIIYFSRPVIEK
ncbi:MAG: CheR family methyltransferase, partial [Planctomycetota bacterium]